jgi:Zn-dependent protease with chaperone function
MSFENPKIPEGINVSDTHPLAEFGFLLAAVALLLTGLLAVAFITSGWLVRFVPFHVEYAFADQMRDSMFDDASCDPRSVAIERRLQSLVDALAQAHKMPDDMILQVHYSDSSQVNAMATLGGHIVVMDGLLQKLPHENALSMVLAHEIAHVKHRDPIVATGRLSVIWIIMSLIPGLSDFATNQLVSRITTLTSYGFSRTQESAADIAALIALENHYGHTSGAQALFSVLGDYDSEAATGILSTHPLSLDRIAAVTAFQRSHGLGNLTDLDFPELAMPSNNDCSQGSIATEAAQ